MVDFEGCARRLEGWSGEHGGPTARCERENAAWLPADGEYVMPRRCRRSSPENQASRADGSWGWQRR